MHQRSRFHHDHVGKLPQRALPIREKALGPEHPKQDLSAVESAVSKPWSNGPVEGHINRLKMLKRQTLLARINHSQSIRKCIDSSGEARQISIRVQRHVGPGNMGRAMENELPDSD